VTTNATDTIRITLDRSDDDSPLNSPDFQQELADFDASLKAQGWEVSPRLRFRDAAGGGAAYIGEFVLKHASGIGAALTSILVAWLKYSNGRKVRLKVGDIEVEAQNVAAVERLVKQVETLRNVDHRSERTE
jgi:hypothetical protein